MAAGLGIPLVLWPLIHTDAPRHVNRTAMGLYRQAAMIVCSSSVEQRWLTEGAGLPPARTLLLECGSWAAESADRAPAVPPAQEGRIELLTVGGFSAHKRLGDQVEAVAQARIRRRWRSGSR